MSHLRGAMGLLLAMTIATGPARAAKVPACDPARYLPPPGDHLIFGEQTPATNAIQIGAGSVRIGCGTATKVKIRGTKKGTKVSAKWPSCGALKNVILAAAIVGDCATLQGSFKAKKVKKSSFTAVRSGGCGDGRIDVDGGEQCEATADCEGDATCTACKCVAPTTTTSNPTTTSSPASTTTVQTTTSTTTTTLSNCVGNAPNGQKEAGEECDDGNANERDGCTNACTVCGNHVVTAPETCDDGNLIDGDGCDSNCQPSACGNGIQGINESCDDGNTSDNDACPSDCVIDPCTPNTGSSQLSTVNFAVGGGASVAGISVLVDYPEGKVSIPGSGSAAASHITGLPSGTSGVSNDLDHALREVVQKTVPGSSITPGQLFRVNYETCAGAGAAVAADFKCTVLSASDPNGSDVTGNVTCSVTVP